MKNNGCGGCNGSFRTGLLNSEPRQPLAPVDRQEGVYWLPLVELPQARLLPNIGTRIITALAAPATIADPFITDWELKEGS